MRIAVNRITVGRMLLESLLERFFHLMNNKNINSQSESIMLSRARAFKVTVKSKWTILIFFMGYCSIYYE